MLRPDKIVSAFHWAGCIHRPACGGTAEFRNAIEFDLAFGERYEVTKDFDCYGGLMYTMVEGEIGAGNDFDADDPLGLFLGGEYDITPQARAGVELRLMSETSLTLMANFAF